MMHNYFVTTTHHSQHIASYDTVQIPMILKCHIRIYLNILQGIIRELSGTRCLSSGRHKLPTSGLHNAQDDNQKVKHAYASTFL